MALPGEGEVDAVDFFALLNEPAKKSSSESKEKEIYSNQF
jgi:hypothetical protein